MQSPKAKRRTRASPKPQRRATGKATGKGSGKARKSPVAQRRNSAQRRNLGQRRLTLAQAWKAFERFYASVEQAQAATGRKWDRESLKRARAYDLQHSQKVVGPNSNYRQQLAFVRNPHKYDFAGVDTKRSPQRRVTKSRRARKSRN